MTVEQALTYGRERLARGPGVHPRRDAERLLRHVIAVSRAALLTYPDQTLSEEEAAAYADAIERRAHSEPIQYITGTQEFYGLDFHVTPAVLIPRPETEHLVEAALAMSSQFASPPRILDIGTGSGSIAITLAHHLPNASIDATDISSAALDIARRNAAAHAVSARIKFMEADLLPPIHPPYDIICSNPPYVPTTDVLEPQVAAFEPHTALFAGPDGLAIYRRLIPLAAAALQPAGALLLENGHGQQAAIASLLRASHLQSIEFIPDLQGIPRVAIATRNPLHQP